jgi:glutaredoxin-related protein
MKIQIYYSSVPSTLKVRKDTTRVQDILTANKVEFEMLDVASNQDHKEYMQQKSQKKILPQIFVDGEFKGSCEELEEANEFGETLKWLQ